MRKNAAKPRVNPTHALPSRNWLKANLRYDPETGILTWKTGLRAGKVAPNPVTLKVRIKDSIFLASRLVLKMTRPDFKETFRAEPRNGKKSDLREANLRMVKHDGTEVRSTPKFPSIEVLRETFSYDPETGIIEWKTKIKSGAPKKETIVGAPRIHAFHRTIPVRRLAWMLHHGVNPGKRLVKNRNGDITDNRMVNLRLVTRRP